MNKKDTHAAFCQAGVPQIVILLQPITGYVYLRSATKVPKAMNDKGFVEISEIMQVALQKLARNLY